LEAFSDHRDAARLEVLDDHEDHTPQFTPARKTGELPIVDCRLAIAPLSSRITNRQPAIENRQFLDARRRRELE
jgi:hypothetical protein